MRLKKIDSIKRLRHWTTFWDRLPEAEKNGWTSRDIFTKAYLSEFYHSRDITLVYGMIGEAECMMLVNLVRSCEVVSVLRDAPVNPANSHGIKEIAEGIRGHSGFGPLKALIDGLRFDMMHDHSARPKLFPTSLFLRRRFDVPEVVGRNHENPSLNSSNWILFLNDDYQGGELFLPTRKTAIVPEQGKIVRWPTGIPHGISSVTDGYQLTLEGMTVPDARRQEDWPDGSGILLPDR